MLRVAPTHQGTDGPVNFATVQITVDSAIVGFAAGALIGENWELRGMLIGGTLAAAINVWCALRSRK